MQDTSALSSVPVPLPGVVVAARMPVGVTSRRRRGSGPWAEIVWEIQAVVAGAKFSDAADPAHPTNPVSPLPFARHLHAQAEENALLWSGLQVELFPDQGESYYANLLASPPKVFVVCGSESDSDPDNGPRPELVTVSYDEAMSHVEGDEDVYSVPMPAEMILWLERYVLANYAPEKRTKRKRVEWTEARPSA